MVTRGYWVLQRVTCGYKGSQGVTKGYKVLQRITVGCKRLPGVTKGYKGLQRITGGYKGLHVVIIVNTCVCRCSVDNKALILSYPRVTMGYWGSKGLQLVTKGYNGLQRVRGGYKGLQRVS